MNEHTLNGQWQFRAADADDWHTGTVPGDVYSDLVSAEVIDHPYDGDTELDVQWVGETDWTYERRFTVDESLLAEDRVLLECLGVDTVSTVAVNGTPVGETDNMHRKYEFDVSDALEPGENRITVAFRSPVSYAGSRAEAHEYDVPLLRYPVDQPNRNFVRKAQCHFGWDWGPCLPGVGIWRDVRLVGYSGPRITYSTTEQTHHEDGDVTLAVRAGVDAPASATATLTAEVGDGTARKTVSVGPDTDAVSIDVTVPDPDRWWPNGYGDQRLYELTVTLADGETDPHVHTDRVGFRTLRLVRDPDDDGGESFTFEVNDTPVYAKGANWIPTDALRRNVDEQRYEHLLTSAVDANMNMIRVWGGGYYELDAFYDLCDELGLLVWQDFMFSCALYPADEAFLDTVEREVRYQVRRLANHPALALWCGNNENEMGLRSWFADAPHIDDLHADYVRLNTQAIGDVVRAEDPSRTFWPGSPSSGDGVDDPSQVDPYDQSRGDLHYWDVWHDGEPFSNYLEAEPRFVSEFGYQSFPSTDLLSTHLPDDQLNPTAPLMEHHQRSPGGNERILQRMTDQFRFPFAFEAFVELSQIQQGLAMKTAIEHWRRLKPYCMGTLYWQLNDLWPCASWSSIAYGGEWKALQYMARRFYAPVLASTVVENGTVDVWLTSDRPTPTTGTLAVDAYSLRGDHVFATEEEVTLEAQQSRSITSVAVDEVDVPPESLVVRVDYDADSAVESYPHFTFLAPYKRLDLPDPHLEYTVEGSSVTLEADAAALFVTLSVPGRDGRFSDNYFHLAPGEKREVTFERRGQPTDPGPSDDEESLADALRVTSLRETY